MPDARDFPRTYCVLCGEKSESPDDLLDVIATQVEVGGAARGVRLRVHPGCWNALADDEEDE